MICHITNKKLDSCGNIIHPGKIVNNLINEIFLYHIYNTSICYTYYEDFNIE
jgi:hypothetical protein